MKLIYLVLAVFAVFVPGFSEAGGPSGEYSLEGKIGLDGSLCSPVQIYPGAQSETVLVRSARRVNGGCDRTTGFLRIYDLNGNPMTAHLPDRCTGGVVVSPSGNRILCIENI